jgi:hypothetical protein
LSRKDKPNSKVKARASADSRFTIHESLTPQLTDVFADILDTASAIGRESTAEQMRNDLTAP